MSWENFKVEHQRLQVVQAYLQKHETMTQICNLYGISRKTAYKWVQRFLEFGEEGLKDLSRAPHNVQNRFNDNLIAIALELKVKRRTWGPKKIHAKLKKLYPLQQWPSPTRLYEVFKDYHLVTSKRLKNRVPATSPLGNLSDCNDTWAVDLKGWFLTGDGKKCEPFTITDCYSRYLIQCNHLSKHTVDYIWPAFVEAFQEYGLPNRVRSDNGPPFGSCGAGRLTKLSVNLIKSGVMPEWITPGHPEQNGRHERFHLTLKQDTANPPQQTLSLQIQTMNQFRHDYNFERPHEALNMQTPATYYHVSPRKWDGILRTPDYDKNFEVRKIEKSGQLKWKSQHIFISETLAGEYVGLKINEDEELECYYGRIYLGKISHNKLEKPKLKTRRQR
jgi:putative transposase